MDIQHIVHPNLKAPLTCVYTSICESYHPRDLNKESNIQWARKNVCVQIKIQQASNVLSAFCLGILQAGDNKMYHQVQAVKGVKW